ncbi:ABC transporter ATP-binding protein [Brevundimonas sp. SL130]|uniref:ABC transporter ATP-binding protein n=1 Tax=Brevundimonas sp. SL130 TaxID=2995143 RepID=UPI00226CF8BB|nr:ABC transporter ATP-binding protein [Brevundimonas sp. SL130]WAC59048.1 ABC transporter ATP-binding protein [Brevundimonas sp. SL130]
MPYPADILLRGQSLGLSYGRREVSRDLDVDIPLGQISVIIGANACGKSTLLRALSRLLPPSAGQIFLSGRDIRDYGAKALARTLAYLPQSASAPHGITAADLVARGRYPHQTLLRQWSEADDQAVRRAMAQAQVADLADRVVDELSGGQRQRVWLALVLAQETPVLLLDEPTTYLDVAHQFEVLELCRTLNRDHGKTLVMVLHDLNQAARYADHVIAMRDGAIVAAGAPDDVLTPERIEQVFGLACMVLRDPVTGTPLIVPTIGGAGGVGVAPQTVSYSQEEAS